MSTRSIIAIEKEDKKVVSVYCHFDGYLKGVGQTLIDNYSDYAKTEKLLKGSMSSLGKTIQETKYYEGGNKEDLPSVYNNEFCLMYDLKSDCYIEFIYLFRNNKWYCSKTETINSENYKNIYEDYVTIHTKFKLVEDLLICQEGLTETTARILNREGGLFK